MTKSSLKSLAGAAVLLLLSTHVASAGPDGTCEDYRAEETASEAAPSTPVPAPTADYTQIAQAAPSAGNNVTLTASTLTADAVASALPAQKGDLEIKRTNSLPKGSQASDASVPPVVQASTDY